MSARLADQTGSAAHMEPHQCRLWDAPQPSKHTRAPILAQLLSLTLTGARFSPEPCSAHMYAPGCANAHDDCGCDTCR